MQDISNRTLALFLVFAIIMSLGATIYSLNKISSFSITGQAQLLPGRVNLSVQNSISILLYNSSVDFGSGWVNVSCIEIKDNSKTFANLSAGVTSNDTSDCWTGNMNATSILVENNGNVNVSVSVRGPSALSFFNNYNGVSTYNLTIKARQHEASSCVSGLNLTYNEMHLNRTMCSLLKYYPDNQDSIGIDINILIPRDLPAGSYRNDTIEFYAVQV